MATTIILESKPSIKVMEDFYKVSEAELQHDKYKDRPYIWYMFVMSADGIGSLKEKSYPDKGIGLSGPGIALAHKKTEHNAASGAYTDWRMLQYGWAVADAVIAGSGIIKAEKDLLWLPDDDDLIKLRDNYSKPLRVLITGNGFNKEELGYAIFHTEKVRTMIATSEKGYNRMKNIIDSMIEKDRPKAEIKTFGQNTVNIDDLLKTLKKEYNIKTVDLQGGPDVAGQFFKNNSVDEYRLTLSPTIAGSLSSQNEIRPTPVKTNFLPDELQAMKLEYLGLSNNHVFLRYLIN